MRNVFLSLLLIVGGATGAAADDAPCVTAPTRACVLAMAAAAIATAGPAGDDPTNAYLSTTWGAFLPRKNFVNETRARLIGAAVRAGDIDLALSVASGIEKGSGVDLPSALSSSRWNSPAARTTLRRLRRGPTPTPKPTLFRWGPRWPPPAGRKTSKPSSSRRNSTPGRSRQCKSRAP